MGSALFGIFDFTTQHIQKDQEFFRQWLDQGLQGSMSYMDHPARQDPSLILEEVQTALVFLFPYSGGHRTRRRKGQSAPVSSFPAHSLGEKKLVARYAHGPDYHKVLRAKLQEKAKKLEEQIGYAYRPIVDSAPFLERAHGRAAGLGFVGKNTLLIRPGMGSFFFIATLLTTAPASLLAEKAAPRPALETLSCGSCQRCIDACPTQALDARGYILDAHRCLSYWSIEHRGTVPEEFLPHFEKIWFGCDICQEVCPYNWVTEEPSFSMVLPFFLNLAPVDIAFMTPQNYEKWFGGTAVTRAKFAGLVRNALYHLYAIRHPDYEKALDHCALSTFPLIVQTVQQLRSMRL